MASDPTVGSRAVSGLKNFLGAVGDVTQGVVETAIPIALTIEQGPGGFTAGQGINDLLFRRDELSAKRKQQKRRQDLILRTEEYAVDKLERDADMLRFNDKNAALDKDITIAMNNSKQQSLGFVHETMKKKNAAHLLTDKTVERIQGTPHGEMVIVMDALAELIFREGDVFEGESDFPGGARSSGDAADRLANQYGLFITADRTRIRNVEGTIDEEINLENFMTIKHEAMRKWAEETAVELAEAAGADDGEGIALAGFTTRAITAGFTKVDAHNEGTEIINAWPVNSPPRNELALGHGYFDAVRRERAGTINSEGSQLLKEQLEGLARQAGFFDAIIQPLQIGTEGVSSFRDASITVNDIDDNGHAQQVIMPLEDFIGKMMDNNPINQELEKRLTAMVEGRKLAERTALVQFAAQEKAKAAAKPTPTIGATAFFDTLTLDQRRRAFKILVSRGMLDEELITFEEFSREDKTTQAQLINSVRGELLGNASGGAGLQEADKLRIGLPPGSPGDAGARGDAGASQGG